MKKWTYLVAACMLAGTTPVITGCVDTDEPAGIEQLRGAKAELLQAKAQVELAKAEVIKAKVAYVNALTREQEAIALQEELNAEKIRLENQLKETELQEQQALLQQQLAKIEQEMEEAAKEHEANMIAKEQAVAEAKRAYEVAMQQIAIAQALGRDEDKVTLASLQQAVEDAYAALYEEQRIVTSTTIDNGFGSTTTTEEYEYLPSLEEQLREASRDLYIATQNKNAGYDTDKNGNRVEGFQAGEGENGVWGDSYWAETLQAQINQAQADKESKEAALKKLQEFQELSVEDTDWAAQLQELQTEIDALVEQRDQKLVEQGEAEGSAEYLTAWQNVYGVYNIPENSDITLDKIENAVKNNLNTYAQYYQEGTGTKNILNEAQNELDAAKRNPEEVEKRLSLPAYELPEDVKITKEMAVAMYPFLASWTDEDAIDHVKNQYARSEVTEYLWTTDGTKSGEPADGVAVWDDENYPFEIKYASDVETRKTFFEEKLEALEEITTADTEAAKNQLIYLNAQKKAAEAKYEDAKEEWKKVVDAILAGSEGKATEVDDKSMTDATTNYNADYNELKTAIDNFNKGLEDTYTTARDEKKAELIFQIKLNYFLTSDDANLTGIQGFNLTTARETWNSTYAGDPEKETEANLEAVILTASANNAQLQAAVLAAINNHVAETADADWEEANKATLDQAGNDAVRDWMVADKDGGKANEKINELAGTLSDSYNNLTDSIDVFKNLAWKYAQSTANDEANPNKATDALNAVVMVGVADETGVFSVNTTSWVADATDEDGNPIYVGGYAKKVLNNNEITDDELAAATKVTYNSDWANADDPTTGYNTLEQISYDTFGYAEECWAEPTKETIMENKTNLSAPAYVYYDLDNQVIAQENIVSAEEDLKAFKAVIQKAYDDFIAQVKADYNDAFGELETALAAAETANDTAIAELEKASDAVDKIAIEVATLNTQISELKKVEKTLTDLVWAYLDGDKLFPNSDQNDGYDKPSTYDPETFAEKLAKAIAQQQEVVAEASQAVAEAQTNYNQAVSGEYDGVAYFQFKLDQVQREWNRAYEAYEKALQDLETAMEVIANTVVE